MNITEFLEARITEDESRASGVQAVGEFLDADFIIPSHGASMALGFTGTAEDAQRIIDKFTSLPA